jgi:hypothetical protein
MRFRIAGAALAFLVSCAAGCGTSVGTSPPVGQSSSAIQGGVTDTKHSFAVVICGGADGGPAAGQNCQILCSGTLIAPNLVLTARHCVDNVSSDTVECDAESFGFPLFPTDQYYITSDYEAFDPEAQWYQAAQIVTPPATSFCGNDLAVLTLGANVPASEVPVLAIPEIWYPVDWPQYSLKETAIGYGLEAPDDTTSSGIRRTLENIPIECIPGDPTRALACSPEADSNIAPGEFAAGNGPCEGDSGSSAYEQDNFNKGTFLSLGVLSRGGSSGNICEGSVYTQLYPWQSLILSAAKEAQAMGGYEPLGWTERPANAPDGGLPEGGTPVDGASDASSGQLPLGANCGSNSACESNQCVSLSDDGDGYVCSQKCSTSEACPTGYGCVMGYCFAGEGQMAEAASSGGGCGVVRSRRESDPRGTWTLALSIALVLSRRQRCARPKGILSPTTTLRFRRHGPHR